MKTHLPLCLLHLSLGAVVSPAFCADIITDGYEIVETDSVQTVLEHATGGSSVAFMLEGSLDFNGAGGAASLQGNRMLFASQEGKTASVCFHGYTGYVLKPAESLTLSGLESAVFQNNVMNDQRFIGIVVGWMSMDGAKAEFSSNGLLAFRENQSGQDGGALCIWSPEDGDLSFARNGQVVFERNVSVGGHGGAISAAGTATKFSENGSVEFIENEASPDRGGGGAIYVSDESLEMKGNGSVLFKGNTSGSGGAVYLYKSVNSPGVVASWSGNDSVVFEGNAAIGEGGAIYGISATVSLNDNGSVLFIGNSSSREAPDVAGGGAISLCRSGGSNSALDIRNNGNVVFSGNYEEHNGEYRLQGIVFGGIGINLSAPEGGAITFYDSLNVRAGLLMLNQEYRDAEDNAIAQTGDIVLSGAHAARDLAAIKGKAGAGEATEAELGASVTSEIAQPAYLFDGRLIIEDGAVYKGDGSLTVSESQSGQATTTLLLRDGVLDNGANMVSFAGGTRFCVEGISRLSVGALEMNDGSSLSIGLSDANLTEAALTLGGTMNMGDAVTLDLYQKDGSVLSGGTYRLLEWADGADADPAWLDSLTLNAPVSWNLTKDHLLWENGVLSLVGLVPNQAAIALSRNQQGVYNALNDIARAGGANGALGRLAEQVAQGGDADSLRSLLDKANGAALSTAMVSQIEGNLSRLRRLRAAMGGGQSLSGQGRWLAYAQANFDEHTLSADSSGPGCRRTEWGGTLGVERRTGAALWGGAVSAGRATVAPSSDSRYHEQTAHFDVYVVAGFRKNWQSVTSAGIGCHSFDFRRSLPSGASAAADDVSGLSFNFLQEVNYTFALGGRGGIQPFLAVVSSLNQLDSFTERGAGNASLHGSGRHAWATDLMLGARSFCHFAAVGGAPDATASFQAGGVASVGDTTADLAMHFTGAPANGFTVGSASRNRWGCHLGASLDVPVSERAAAYVSAGAVLRGDSAEANAQVGMRFVF